MSTVALCTDSSSLLTATAAAELGVELVPIPVAVDGEQFDGPTDEFYERMRSGAKTSTSQPSPSAFTAAYERAAAAGATSVLSLHLDRRISGVAESAALGARETEIPVRVVALTTVSYGVGLCTRAAHAALRGEATIGEAADDAERIAAALDNAFVARAAPGGRVAGSDDWALLRFVAGGAEPLSAHATLDEAAAAMRRRILAGRPGLAAVGYAGRELEAAADRLAHELLDDEVAAVERYRVTPSVGGPRDTPRVGAPTGPDSFGAFWWPAPT